MITTIEQALQSCNADKFANICRLYLSYKYNIINSTGFVVGKEKSKKGTPDNFIPYKDFFIFNEITTINKKQLVLKLKKDIEHCFMQNVVASSKIVKIILICNNEITLKIQEELNNFKNTFSTNTDLEIIGIDAFATIIFRDYPQISKELGLPIDTGQILEITDFISQYEDSKFATPLSNKFFNREEDLKVAIEKLIANDILLISGSAGTGKTKFSLELVEKYKESNPNFIIKYIKNNGNQNIWEDLKIQLTNTNSYLIVVDDANKLKSNLELIINFKNDFEAGKLKIILTVRNYVKSEVETYLNRFSSIELKNFDKQELNKILQSSSFNITKYYADKIYSISKGNPRIAIMGAIAGKNNDINKLTNASIILDEYFSSVNDKFKNDDELLKVAGILSLFRVIDISNNDTIEEIYKYFNISKNTLIEKLKLLFENEIADEYKSTYKIADQILGEYMFYLIFIKNKKLNFKLLIDIHFDEYKLSLMKLLTPIVSNYGFEEIKILIIDDIKLKWKELKNQNDCLRFLKDFWFYLPTETLIYINQLVKSIEKEKISDYKFEVYIDNYTQRYDDKIIDILINFQQLQDKIEFAFDILLNYCITNNLLFSKLLKVYKQSFIYSQYSYETDYYTQIKLLDFLYSKVEINKEFYSKIILFIAPKFLVDSYNATTSDGNKMYFGQIPIVLTSNHIEFRNKLWLFIFDCYKDLALKENVYTFFENYKSSYFNNQNPIIIEFDRYLVLPFFSKNFSNKSFNEATIISDYTKRLNYSKIKYDTTINKKINNKEFELWLLLNEKAEENKKAVLKKTFNYQLSDYKRLFKQIDIIYSYKENYFKGYSTILDSISSIIAQLAKKDFELFLKVFKILLNHKFSSNIFTKEIFNNIKYDTKNALKLKAFILNNKTASSNIISLLINIPVELITKKDYFLFFNFLKNDFVNNISFMEDVLQKVTNLDIDINIELGNIIDVLFDKTITNNHLYVSHRFFEFLNNEYPEAFLKNLNKIEKIYLFLDQQERHFDYQLDVLKLILNKNPKFINQLLNSNFEDKTYLSKRDFLENDFSKLWELDNYEIVFRDIIKFTNKFDDTWTNCSSEVAAIFKGNNEKELNILISLVNETNNLKSLRRLFNIIVTKFNDERFYFLSLLLQKNKSIDLFERLDFYVTSTTYSGSRIPRIQFKISELEKVIKFLENQKNIDYLEHIKILEERIIYSKMDIEQERKREFMSEWSI